MTDWRWVCAETVYAVHDQQIAEHGGLPGVRDRNVIESALARPQNLAAYEAPDIASLAVAYAFGLVRNHDFADGNKRTAWVIARVFMADNGARLLFEKAQAVVLMEQVAAGVLAEGDLAAWFRARLQG